MTGEFPPACLQTEPRWNAAGAVREVREADADAEWSADSGLESGYPRRWQSAILPAQATGAAKSQSDAAIKWGAGAALF